jgi:hypothetical protein
MIRRLYVQAQGGLIKNGCGADPDSSGFTVYLQDGKQVLLADAQYIKFLIST